MDDIDLAILQCVQKNARISVKDVSAQVNLSIPATSERLKRLKNSGVITGYTVTLDHEKLNKGLACFCLVVLDAHDTRAVANFMAYVEEMNDILECHRVTGAYEYLLKIKTSSTRSLEAMLATLRDRWGVAQSLTYTVLSTFKETTASVPETTEHLR